jgi:uncharacterized membrane protein YqaE (UPF0057 family)
MKKTTVFIFSILLIFSIGKINSYASVAMPADNALGIAIPVRDSGSLKSALAEFKSLSKKERKERVKEAKKSLKEYKKQKRGGGEPSTDKVLLVILAILLPPLAVYLHQGEINTKFWIDLVLTLLFFLPGIIYALIVILDKD